MSDGRGLRPETSEELGTDHAARIGRSRLRTVDAFGEAAISTLGRPGRTVLTALGTILGVAAVVATLGIVNTAKSQISESFNAVTSTQITVSDLGADNISLDSEKAALKIGGVAEAGISWEVADKIAVASDPDPTQAAQFSTQVPLYAASAAGLAPAGFHVAQGRLFDSGNDVRKDHVALIGTVAAESLGITTTVNRPAVFVNGEPFTVVGIVDAAPRQPGALTGITIPATTALGLIPATPLTSEQFASGGAGVGSHGPELFVTTNLGAAQVVGRQLAYTVSPTDPGDMSVSVPPDPRSLRSHVEGTAGTLVLLLGALSTIIGIVAIANTTLVAVIERTPEIGLRRALGARPRHIGASVLLEAAVIGGVGGIVGTTIGVFATVGTAYSQTWTAVLDVRVVIAAPIAGVLAGLIAGIYPARRATRIEPATALQRL